jgi:hypothetical protein
MAKMVNSSGPETNGYPEFGPLRYPIGGIRRIKEKARLDPQHVQDER